MFVFRHLLHNSYRAHLLFPYAALSLTALVIWSSVPAEQPSAVASSHVQRQVQPLDPLTPEEIEIAARIANSDAKVKAALGSGRHLLIEVSFLALKSPGYREAEPQKMKIGRHAAVIFYRYDDDIGIHVVIDLEQKAAGEITRLQGTAVPLAYQEVVEAFNLALRNERVRALLGARANEFKVFRPSSAGERSPTRVEGLRVVTSSPGDPCFKHRCVDLLFRLPRGYLAGTSVTVDLTAQTVRVERTLK